MMRVRLNPKHWQISQYKAGDLVVTHDPVEVSDRVGTALLDLRRNGVALVVEAEPEEETEQDHLLDALTEEAPDDGDGEGTDEADDEEMIQDGS
jgi:hypothetical protein